MSYRIRTVAEITGIPRNTLIAWERRYGYVRPERHENGYRSYSEEDLARLLRLRDALHSGLKISEAIEVLSRNERFARDLPGVRAPLEPPRTDPDREAPARPAPSSPHFERLCEQLTDALVHYRRQDAELLLAQLVTVPFEDRVHQVFFPVLTRIGNLWEQGVVSVVQEHYASSIIREQLISILVGIGTKHRKAPHAVCTTFPNEHHEIAALALGVHLGLHGYRLSYLGADLPLEDLIEFCGAERPDLVCVSVIRNFHKESLETYAAALRARTLSPLRIVLGGRGVGTSPPPQVEGVEFIENWFDFRP